MEHTRPGVTRMSCRLASYLGRPFWVSAGPLLVCATLSACSAPSGTPNGAPRITPPAQPFLALAVAALEMPRGSPDFEAAKRTEDILEALWRSSKWEVLAPSEFRILHRRGLDNPGPLTATDLVVRAKRLGLDPHRFALLTSSVFMRESSSQAETSKGDESGMGFHGSADVGVSLLLRDAMGEHIAELEIERPIDPFAEKPDYDRRPELRDAVQEITRLLISHCPSCFVPVERPSFDLRASPAVLLSATDEAGRTLRERVMSAGPLEQDQLLWTHLQYLEPDIDLAAAKRHLTTTNAACFGEDAPSPFRPGDCVQLASTQPAPSRFELARQLRTGGGMFDLIGANGERRIVDGP